MIRVLVVAVTYGGTGYYLEGCAADLTRMKSIVARIGVTDARYLTDTTGTINDSTYPTRNNVLEAIATLVRKSKAGDRIFLHFSGHGFYVGGNSSVITNAGHRISDATSECLLTRPNSTPTFKDIDVNSTICDDQIVQLFDLMHPEARALITIDACSSGTMMDLGYNLQVRHPYSAATAQFNLRRNADASATNRHIVVFTSVREKKFAWDVTDQNGIVYGIFTKVFTDAIEAALTQNKQLTYLELLYIIDKPLRDRKNSQDPQLSVSNPEYIHEPVLLLR